ncbi:glycine betaine ABC transporter substrate-binding protein [Egicoccus halophilus]|uniref:Glycine/betaine ABC transporter substrate-binding protein n=1 Tax=Egicoccus halophilus TaxID=1670830 RepID=A0A8J3A6J9_9ACTN|nr:glycine betaine ABC transporter substrate-binding protein [Egicoccus halophilus]GGI04405.1 glycine/betaine ABC transporter substrate-binding protein [Egicoccus halophilus]
MRHLSKTTAGAAALALLLTACGADDFGGGDDTATGDDTTTGDTTTDDGTDADADAAADAVEPGSESLDGATITVGSKDFDEQLILGEISKLLLEDAGATVVDEIDLGSTFAAREALTGGQIDHYWEYTGTAWIEFYGETEPIADREEQYEAVRELEVGEGLYWLEPSPFNNTYGIAMSREAHDELGVDTLTELGELIESDPDAATLCVESEFEARSDGLPGMEAHYGYEFDPNNVSVLDTGVIYGATADRDPCNFGEIFTTDGRIATLDLVVLEDDQSFFPLYNVSPVFVEDVYEQYGQTLSDLYAPVTAALDDETMAELNARVSSENERPLDVAQDWLTENDFIG